MGKPSTIRVPSRPRDDSGFTLVEAVVALFVLATIFTALAYASIGSLRASVSARLEQQAIDFATQALEEARQADFHGLAHVASDLAGDPRITTCDSASCIDPGTGTPEPLVVSSSGAVSPHISQVDATLSNNFSITLSRYVTDPGDASADYKRVTVVASWRVGGLQRERVTSSLVTETTRGLPLPVFKLTPIGDTATAVNPGATVPFGLELTNQGAPDRWNLVVTEAAAADWALYRDDGDGIWEDPTVDVALTNTNSPDDALVDTGRIDPTGSIVFWVVRTVPSTAAAGLYRSVLTATSAAQASAATGTASVDLWVEVLDTGVAVEDDPDGQPQGVVPGPPQNLQVTTGDGELVANWQVPLSSGSSSITDYVVSYKLQDAVTWSVLADGVSLSTTVTITGLVNGSTYDIGIAAQNDSGVGALTSAPGTPQSGVPYTTPVTCPATTAPAATASNGYSLRSYALHNRSAANPTWPGTGTIAATSTIGQGLPLSAAVDGPQVPAQTNLPVYSSDVVAGERGRIVVSGGSFTTSDTTRVVDWRSTSGSKAYKGTALLRMWVAPVSGDEASLPMTLRAQLYIRRSSGTLQAEGGVRDIALAANTFGTTGCLGWREVLAELPVNQASLLGSNEFIGVRVWNPAVSGDGLMSRVRVAYDVVGDFPATLTVPEKP